MKSLLPHFGHCTGRGVDSDTLMRMAVNIISAASHNTPAMYKLKKIKKTPIENRTIEANKPKKERDLTF